MLFCPSFRRKPESSFAVVVGPKSWIPAFAGMTALCFY